MRRQPHKKKEEKKKEYHLPKLFDISTNDSRGRSNQIIEAYVFFRESWFS